MHVGRNDPCWCGSGKKFKKCCVDLGQLEDSVRIDPRIIRSVEDRKPGHIATTLGWLDAEIATRGTGREDQRLTELGV